MRIYTVAQVADELQTSRKTVMRLLETGKLKGKQLGGCSRNYWRVTQSQLDAYLKADDNPVIPETPTEPITTGLLRLTRTSNL